MGLKSDLIATQAQLATAEARIAELLAKYEPKPVAPPAAATGAERAKQAVAEKPAPAPQADADTE